MKSEHGHSDDEKIVLQEEYIRTEFEAISLIP